MDKVLRIVITADNKTGSALSSLKKNLNSTTGESSELNKSIEQLNKKLVKMGGMPLVALDSASRVIKGICGSMKELNKLTIGVKLGFTAFSKMAKESSVSFKQSLGSLKEAFSFWKNLPRYIRFYKAENMVPHLDLKELTKGKHVWTTSYVNPYKAALKNMLTHTKLFVQISITFFKEVPKKLIQGLKECKLVIKDFNKDIKEGIAKAFGGQEQLDAFIGKVKTLISLLGKLLITLGLIKSIRNTINVAAIGDDINDQSQKIYMNTTAYQEWGYVLQQNGIEIKSLKMLMRTFAKQVAGGSDALKKYGINATNVSDAFEQAVYAIQNLNSETEKISAATELFGTRASELMPIFNMTNAETKELLVTYRAIGATMSDELIRRSDILTDSITALKAAWQGLRNTLAYSVIPIITKVVQWLTVLIAKINILLQAIFGIDYSKDAFNSIGNAASGAGSSMEEATKSASKLKKQLMGFDELNVLQSQDTGSTEIGGTDFSDYEDFGSNFEFDSSILSKLTDFKDKVDGIADKLQFWVPTFEIAAGLILICTGHIFAGAALLGLGITTGVSNGLFDDVGNAAKAVAAALVVSAGLVLILKGHIAEGAALAGITLVAGLGAATGFSDLDSNIKSIAGFASTAAGVALIMTGQFAAGLALLGYGVSTTVGNVFTFDWKGAKEEIKTNAKAVKDAWNYYWSEENADFRFPKIKEWLEGVKEKCENLSKYFKSRKGKMGEELSEMWGEIKKNVGEIKITLPKWSDIKAKWNDLMKNFKDKKVKISLDIKAKVEDLKKWINTSIIDKLNSAIGKVPLLKNLKIPRLAKGGVLTTPTVALLGEYAGARTNNPEIAAPQSLIRETIDASNAELASAFIQVGRQIIQAIENKEMEVSIGDDAIAKSAARGNNAYYKRTGKPLLSV